MARHRRTGSRNWARGVFATFWILLGGVSGLYLFTVFTDPSALGGQLVTLNPSGGRIGFALVDGTTSAIAGQSSEASDQELAEIKASLRELSEQVAELSTRLKPDREGRRHRSRRSPPAASVIPAPRHRDEEARAPPPAPPPPGRASRRGGQAGASRGAQACREAAPAAKPVEQAAVEPGGPEACRRRASLRRSPCRRSRTTRPKKRPRQAATCRRRRRLPPPPKKLKLPLHPRPRQRPPKAQPWIRSRYRQPPMTARRATASRSARWPSRMRLRPLWREFLTNHAALVAGLQPRRVLAPDKKWRLIAGPFGSADEASSGLRAVQEGVAAVRGDGLRGRRALVFVERDLVGKPVPTSPPDATSARVDLYRRGRGTTGLPVAHLAGATTTYLPP